MHYLFLTNKKLFTLQIVNQWTEVMWITSGLLWCIFFNQMFGLTARHPFTVTDQLVSKWCNTKFIQICFDKETKSQLKFSQNFHQLIHFWVNYSNNACIVESPEYKQSQLFWVCNAKKNIDYFRALHKIVISLAGMKSFWWDLHLEMALLH